MHESENLQTTCLQLRLLCYPYAAYYRRSLIFKHELHARRRTDPREIPEINALAKPCRLGYPAPETSAWRQLFLDLMLLSVKQFPGEGGGTRDPSQLASSQS